MCAQGSIASPSLAYSVFLFEELHEILTAFQANGVEVIILKGAALAETVYAHIGLRPMCDIDLLIRPDKADTVATVLFGSGYRPAPNNPAAYMKTDTLPVLVDVHTVLAHLTSDDMARVWREAKDAVIAGAPAKILSCEDTLVHIISHMSFSHGVVLEKWMRDIDRVVRHYERALDWKRVVARIEQGRLAAPALYIFTKAARGLGTPIPARVLTGLRSKNKNPFDAFFFPLLLSRTEPVRYLDYLLPVFTTQGFFNKAKLIFRWVFPSQNIIKSRFGISNPILVPLCYAARGLTLAIKACAGLADLFMCGVVEACQRIRRQRILR